MTPSQYSQITYFPSQLALGTHWKKLRYTQHQPSHTHLNIAAAARPWAQWNCEQSGSCPHAGSRNALHVGTRQTGSAPGTDGSWNISERWNAQCGPDICKKIQSTRGLSPPHLLLLTYDIQTFDWAGKGHKQIDSGRDRLPLGKANPALPPYQAWVVIFTFSTWVMLYLSSEIRRVSKYAAKIPTPLVQHLPMSQGARNPEGIVWLCTWHVCYTCFPKHSLPDSQRQDPDLDDLCFDLFVKAKLKGKLSQWKT